MTLRRFSTSNLATGSKSSKLWDGETFPGYFESIATIVVGSAGAANVEFTNIPNTYTHLQVRGIVFTTTTDYSPAIQFNSDTGSNYRSHIMNGNGSVGTGSSPNSPTEGVLFGKSYAASDTHPTGLIIDILDYKNTNKYKTIRTFGGNDRNGSGEVSFISTLWKNTAAITSIKIYAAVNLKQYTHFALYGIRSA